jgi:hypothetical protein
MLSSCRIGIAAPYPLHQYFHIFPKIKNQIQFQSSHFNLKAHCFEIPKSMRKLGKIFRSTKPNRPLLSNSRSPIKRHSKEISDSTLASASSPLPLPPPSSPYSPSSLKQRRKGRRLRDGGSGTKRKRVSAWSVYLIVSSRLPRTYVGVTTNFTRRLVFCLNYLWKFLTVL